MTTLFIGNTKKQHEDFAFNMPESGKRVVRRIPAGHQDIILKDATPEQVAAVVDQHKRYGLVSEAEAKKVRNFIGLMWSTDKPIKLQSLQLAFEHNKEIMEETAQKNLEAVGAATKANLDTISREGEGTGLPRVELEVVEQPKEGVQAQVAKGVEVVKEGVAPGKSRRK